MDHQLPIIYIIEMFPMITCCVTRCSGMPTRVRTSTNRQAACLSSTDIPSEHSWHCVVYGRWEAHSHLVYQVVVHYRLLLHAEIIGAVNWHDWAGWSFLFNSTPAHCHSFSEPHSHKESEVLHLLHLPTHESHSHTCLPGQGEKR